MKNFLKTTLVVSVFCISSGSFAQQALAETASVADSFVDSIGVNAHLDETKSNYYTMFNTVPTGSPPGALSVVAAFENSGIRHVRFTSFPAGSQFDQYTKNAAQLASTVMQHTGVRIGFALTGQGWNCSNITNYLSTSGNTYWLPLANIDYFEGLNEWNGTPCPNNGTWYAQDAAFQAALWNSAQPTLSSIPVLGPSLAFFDSEPQFQADIKNLYSGFCAALGKTSGCAGAYMTYGNDHVYADWHAPSAYFQYIIPPQAYWVNGSHPIVVTESGYHNDIVNCCGISEHAGGNYYSRLFFEFFNYGTNYSFPQIIRTYAYELLDDTAVANYNVSTNPASCGDTCPADTMGGWQANFGLIRSNGTPKPAFAVISNEIAILKDPQNPSGSFPPGNLNYTLTNASNGTPIDPTIIHHTLLQKANGTFYLALWQEVDSWENQGPGCCDETQRPSDWTTDWITVQFNNRTFSSVNQYDPRNSSHWFWSNQKVSNITVPVNDFALILELVP